MQEQWQSYSSKFLKITPREQILIAITGLFFIVFILYTLIVESYILKAEQYQKNIDSLITAQRSANTSISEFSILLARNPNKALQEKIDQYEAELGAVDQELLTLTSELINPIDMRKALVKLLNLQKGVSLVSFELLGAEQVVSPELEVIENENGEVKAKVSLENDHGLSLYRHGVKIKLAGRYFQLRDYLARFEQLPWKFFWQGFNYQVKEYPNSELEIEIYSLSTRKEFIGV